MSLGTQLQTIQCPNCQRSLPPKAVQCQFCGASLANVPRPQPVVKTSNRREPETYIRTLYYLVSAWWLLGGTIDVITGVRYLADGSIAGIISLIFGGVTALVGLGLILKIELARGIANVCSWLKILNELFGVPFLLFGMILPPVIFIFMIVMKVLNLVSAGLLIWLISETD